MDKDTNKNLIAGYLTLAVIIIVIILIHIMKCIDKNNFNSYLEKNV